MNRVQTISCCSENDTLHEQFIVLVTETRLVSVNFLPDALQWLKILVSEDNFLIHVMKLKFMHLSFPVTSQKSQHIKYLVNSKEVFFR